MTTPAAAGDHRSRTWGPDRRAVRRLVWWDERWHPQRVWIGGTEVRRADAARQGVRG